MASLGQGGLNYSDWNKIATNLTGILKCVLTNENYHILILIPVNVSKGAFDNKSALVQWFHFPEPISTRMYGAIYVFEFIYSQKLSGSRDWGVIVTALNFINLPPRQLKIKFGQNWLKQSANIGSK